jgi:hypothetical protein
MLVVESVRSLLPVVTVYANLGATNIFRLSRRGEKNSTLMPALTDEKSEVASTRL